MTEAKHRPLVIAGPSGVGKSTLINRLMEHKPELFGFSVSHTTRKIRPGEKDGVNYHYSTEEVMKKDIAEGKYIESAVYASNLYGTSIKAVDDVANQGKICILDIDLKGVISVKAKPDVINPRFIMLVPPDMQELERRLRGRGDTDEKAIAERLQRAKEELGYKDKADFWDIVIVAKDKDSTFNEAWAFLQEQYGV